MGNRSRIEWTDATWNPVTGCSKVSPGCEHCYAERMSHRFGWTSLPWTGPNAEQNVVLHEDRLEEPLRWRKPRMVFVCSMSDLFHQQVPDEYIDEVFAVMALTPQHTYQVLTKRPERMRRYLTTSPNPRELPTRRDAVRETIYSTFNGYQTTAQIPWPLPNVWLGVTAEDQRRANERIPLLLQTPAAVRFVSAEPLLGPIRLDCISRRVPHDDWTYYDDALTGFRATKAGGWYDAKLDWVIAGGESGPGARPMHPDWARSLRDQAVSAGLPFFFKQWGEWAADLDDCNLMSPQQSDPDDYFQAHGFPDGEKVYRVGKRRAGRLLDGRTWDEMPRAEVTA